MTVDFLAGSGSEVAHVTPFTFLTPFHVRISVDLSEFSRWDARASMQAIYVLAYQVLQISFFHQFYKAHMREGRNCLRICQFIHTCKMGTDTCFFSFFSFCAPLSQHPGPVLSTVSFPDLKSGIPAEVLIPAPVKLMKCFDSLIQFASLVAFSSSTAGLSKYSFLASAVLWAVYDIFDIITQCLGQSKYIQSQWNRINSSNKKFCSLRDYKSLKPLRRVVTWSAGCEAKD